MTLVLQRLLLTASVLVICLSAAVTGTTTRGNTPVKSTTTTAASLTVSPARQNGLTPTKSSASPSRRPTPSRSSTLVSPARLDQTPTKSSPNGASSSPLRATPTTSRSQSQGSIRPTPATTPQNIQDNSSSSVSLRPTPRPAPISSNISRRETPSTTPRNGGGSTSFFSQPVSSPTPTFTQFVPVTGTSQFTQPFSSTTPLMTQLPQSQSTALGPSSIGPSASSGSVTSGVVTGGTMSTSSNTTSSNTAGANTTVTGGSVTTSGGGMSSSATTGGGGGSVTSSGASSGSQTATSQGASSSSQTMTSQGASTSSASGSSSQTSASQQPSSSVSSSGGSSSGSSTMSGGMTTTGGGEVEPGGQVIHVQIIFCNDYYSMYSTLDPNQRVGYTSQLQAALANVCGVAPERIQGLFIVKDPATGRVVIQFDVVPGPGMSSDKIVVTLQNRVMLKSFSLSDINKSVLYMNCYDSPSPPIFPWTDYGPCPYQRCMNYGRCNVRVTGQYYCECRQPYTGQYCDGMGEKPPPSEPNKLLWLLTIPAAVALLSLILCCLFCWNRRCCCFASNQPVKVVEVIEDDVYQDVDTRSLRSVHSCRSCASQAPSYGGSPMMVNDPGSTYYHALGRPFAVAFNDNTFSAVGYATNDMGLYSTTGGKRSLCGDEEIQVIMNGRGSCCGSDGGGYHSAGMGNKYAVAYNDRTFNTYSSMPRYDRIRSYN